MVLPSPCLNRKNSGCLGKLCAILFFSFAVCSEWAVLHLCVGEWIYFGRLLQWLAGQPSTYSLFLCLTCSILENTNIWRKSVFFTCAYVVHLVVAIAMDDKSCCSPLWYFTVIAIYLLGWINGSELALQDESHVWNHCVGWKLVRRAPSQLLLLKSFWLWRTAITR